VKVADWHYNQQSDLPSCGALPSNTRWWWVVSFTAKLPWLRQGDGLECVERKKRKKKTRSLPKIEIQFAGRPPPSLITVHGQMSKANAFLKNANKSKVKTKLTRPQTTQRPFYFVTKHSSCHGILRRMPVFCAKTLQCSGTRKKIHTVLCEWIGQWCWPTFSGTVTEFFGKANGLSWLTRDNFYTNRAKLVYRINPLNAELNPICRLLVLLGDLTFMGPCIVSVFQ
jgi:hypothetical protein